MTKTSTAMSLVGSLAFVSIAALLGMAGHAANAQTRSSYSNPPSYQGTPFARDGSVVDHGEIVGRDPDQNIRSDILREHGTWDRGGN